MAFRYLNLDIWNVTKVAEEDLVKGHKAHVRVKQQSNGKICLVLQTHPAREVWRNMGRPRIQGLTFGEAVSTFNDLVDEINPRSRGYYAR